jgi:hypothetical protein
MRLLRRWGLLFLFVYGRRLLEQARLGRLRLLSLEREE